MTDVPHDTPQDVIWLASRRWHSRLASTERLGDAVLAALSAAGYRVIATGHEDDDLERIARALGVAEVFITGDRTGELVDAIVTDAAFLLDAYMRRAVGNEQDTEAP